MTDIVHCLAPDVGATFVSTVAPLDNGYVDKNEYRVTGWLKKSPARAPVADPNDMRTLIQSILDDSQQEIGPDQVRLQWCSRKEAEYVTGSGVSGKIARLSDIKVTGRVNWPEKLIDEARQNAIRRIGLYV